MVVLSVSPSLSDGVGRLEMRFEPGVHSSSGGGEPGQRHCLCCSSCAQGTWRQAASHLFLLGPSATCSSQIALVSCFICRPHSPAQADNANEAASSTASFLAWRKQSGRVRADLGISSGFADWTSRTDIALLGVPRTERILDLLNIAWGARLQAMPKSSSTVDLRRGYWCNLSQEVQRRPWGSAKTLTSRGLWYSFEKDVTLDGADVMRLQGAPFGRTANLSSAALKDLAGESFFIPSVASFIVAIYYQPYACWWKPLAAPPSES